ncbi:MAG: hypothetical protein KKE73_09665 [Proteobacteria bacterium]|nr:hypothetical protein [Pseudomonadota bacterium]
MDPVTIQSVVAIAQVALTLGAELTAQLQKLSDEGVEVPKLDDLVALRNELRGLPDLASGKE